MTNLVRNAVVAVALDDTSEAAWDMALALNLAPEGRLHVCHTVEMIDNEFRANVDVIAAKCEAAEQKLQAFIAARLGSASHPLASRVELTVCSGTAADALVQLAVDVEADVIVLGTREKKGLTRLFLGSVSTAVFRKAPCSVLVARVADYAGLEKRSARPPGRPVRVV
jgi:nucleotide-binding universal stress UspA family protein